MKTKQTKTTNNLKRLCALASVAFIVAAAYGAFYGYFAKHLTDVPSWTPHAVALVVMIGFVSVAYCFNNCNDQ